MSKVIKLQNKEHEEWEYIIDELKDVDVSHAVVAYRKQDGDLCYRVWGADHTTFLIGMLDRVKQDLHLE